MPTLPAIRHALGEHRPATLDSSGKNQAAVAMVLRGAPEAPEVLFIERARHPHDPWSGHMAFPGGRVDPGDGAPRDAAVRETLEEVGITLDAAEPIGRLDDMEGGPASKRPLVVSAFVYRFEGPSALVPNHEVEQAFWFPVASLLDPERQVEYPLRWEGRRFPGILVGEPDRHIVWGLTYRFLEGFFEIVGRPLPDRWGEGFERFRRA